MESANILEKAPVQVDKFEAAYKHVRIALEAAIQGDQA